ncbi:type VI secretion system Vgr family protein [Rubrivirga sp. IMCC45206]|uniref:type VI secretion system Vgr family protein n=1 Tax=Rubrivirga sp. IMCC45206 TaxID=3391614 RepID=UPI00398FBE6E
MSLPARHTFTCDALDDDTFVVTKFKGVEAISRPFRFVVHLLSRTSTITFSEVIDEGATLTMARGLDGDGHASEVHGIVSRITLLGTSSAHPDYFVYRAVLTPRLSRLRLSTRSRIFQTMTVEDIVKEVLDKADVAHEWRLSGTYAPRTHTTQYQETDLAFVQRLLEFEGIRYHFEATGGDGATTEKVVLSDGPPAGTDDSQGTAVVEPAPAISDDALAYDFDASLDTDEDVVTAVRLDHRIVPRVVKEKDYNYRQPDADLFERVEAGSVEDSKGKHRGVLSEAMTHTETVDRNAHIAQVRLEEIETTRRVVTGTSNCVQFRSGHQFTLKNHFRDGLNRALLLTHVAHAGTQQGLQTDGAIDYRNDFRSVLASTPYRPPRTTPIPRLPGVLTAKVESTSGTGNGKDNVTDGIYAPTDEHGRYRVRFPFDIGDADTQQATKPVRLAQPYTGRDYGQHFPVHENAEMVIACVDGNPDRIVGLGTVPNHDQTSPIDADNRFENIIKTAADNEIVLKDKAGKVGINLKSPLFDENDKKDGHARLHLGAADGSVQGVQIETDGTTLVHGGSGVWVKAGGSDPESMMGMDIGDFGTAWTVADAAVGLFATTLGIARLNAAWKTATFAAGIANTVAGTAMGWQFPGIFMTSPGGIMMGTAAGISAYGGAGGIGLTSGSSLDLTATMGISLLTGIGGISLGALNGGVGLTAAKGNIEMDAMTGMVSTMAAEGIHATAATGGIEATAVAGNIETTATAGNIEMTATAGELTLSSATKLTLKCGPGKIEMLPSGEIEITTGAHTFKLAQAGITLKSLGVLNATALGSMALSSDLDATFKGGARATVKGAMLDVQATASATLNGAIINIG